MHVEPPPEVVRSFATVWDHLVVEDPLMASDAILCFGTRYPRVPDRAAALFHLGVAPLVVVSGGPPVPEAPSEADLMAAALIEHGVPSGQIVRERRARHTGENVSLGLAALGEETVVRRLTLVSWPLQARRSCATTDRQRPDLVVASAPALRRPGWRWRPTPRRVGFALGELDRLHRYADEGHVSPQPAPAPVDEAAAVLRAWI